MWQPSDEGMLARRDRQTGIHRAYIPDPLGVDLPQISPRAQQAAEDALARADERIGSRGSYLNHLLIRSESISSSWIEGNRITPKKLAIAETLESGTRTALEVVATVHATEQAIDSLADRSRSITTQDIVDLQHTIEPRLRPVCVPNRTGWADPGGAHCGPISYPRPSPRFPNWSRIRLRS